MLFLILWVIVVKDFEEILKEKVLVDPTLLCIHLPYIIKFSEDENDLSNAPTVEKFLKYLVGLLIKLIQF